MNELVDHLIALIKQEEDVLSDFLSCLSRQKEFIIQNKVDDFDLTVAEEENLIQRIHQIENGRMAIISKIASSAGSPADELTLTRLIEMNLGEMSGELKEMKKTLAGLIEQIKRANRVNQYLIKRSLSLIQKNINWFIDDNNLNVIYLPDGRQKVNEFGNLLVDKVL
jgi:flagellar biosynthesis/type III secretory pathway chaperone